MSDKGSELSDAEKTIHAGIPIGAVEVPTRQCPACQKVLPAQAHFCPSCGHPMNQYVADVKNDRKATITLATTQQESSVAATEGRGEEQEEDEEEEGPITTFRKRRIDFRTLNRPLQVLLLLTLAQIGVVALLLATQNLPQPQIFSGVISEDKYYVVPIAAFIVLAVSLLVGTWFAVAGALRVHWSVRFLVLALATWILASFPVSQLLAYAGLRGEPFVTETRVRWIQLALLATFWIWALAISVVRWRAWRKGTVLPSEDSSWHGWAFGIVVVPILLYYILDLVAWRADAAAGFPSEGKTLFLLGIGSQVYNLFSLLLLLIYWYSTDLLEWSEIIGLSMVSAMRRVRMPLLLVTVTVLAAAAMLVNELRVNGWSIFLGLALLVIPMVLVALVVRFAQIRSDWPTRIPPLAFLLGAIVLYLQFVLIDEAVEPVAIAHGLSLTSIESLYLLLTVPVLLVALTIGLVLVARGRMGKPKQGAIGLFLVMVTLLSLTTGLFAILSAAGFSSAILQQPHPILGSLMFFAAGGTLVWVGSLLVRRKPLREDSKVFASVFLLLLGLQAIDWLGDLANGIAALGELSTVLLAGLFVLTTLWDLVTSGEQVTNTGSPTFPREGRMLLYLGYTLVVTSLFLYTGSLHPQTANGPAPDFFSTDADAFLGLFFLGAPMIVLTFLLSVGRRIPHTTEATAPQPAGRVSSAAIQLGIVGSGALALALIAVFIISSALPRLYQNARVQPGQATYTAKSPGPGCDTGGALWEIAVDAPISLHCLPSGTRITALPNKHGSIGFNFPGYGLAQNYDVSVQIDFSNAPHSCVGILTRFSNSGFYENAICADGFWDLGRSLDKFSMLAYGQMTPTHTYTLEAATDGSQQSLTINGIEKASVTDGTLTGDRIMLAVVNRDISTKSVILSNFSYIPSPKSTSTATSPSSIPSSAVLAFRDPLTSPGRWQNQPVDSYGTACQFVQNGYQVQVTRKNWIGACGGVGHQDYANFVFEVHMRIVAGFCGGIEFRVTDNSAGYYFLVCRTGAYALLLGTRSGQSILIAEGVSPFIASGLHAENLITVVANGTKLAFYVNQKQIYGTTDSTYSHGLMDVLADTGNSTLTQVVYWDASVWTF